MITGASGCIGHYIVEALLNDTPHELFLLVRQPQKLQFNLEAYPRAHILQGSLTNITAFAELLATLDGAILVATAWGGNQDLYDINVRRNLQLMNLLDPDRCKQVIYFSTASILDHQQRPLPAAETLGTGYIRTKYQCHQRLRELAIYPRITTLFPTLVFGGDKDKPYSHISAGLADVIKWMGLIRFFKADGSFHFIHARDIALVVRHLIDHSTPADPPKQYVLGNACLTANQAIEAACDYLGQRLYLRVPLSLWLADVFIRLFRVRMAAWDRFCLHYRHFSYEHAVNPASFGLEPYCPSFEELLRVSGIPPG
ncbi:hypothetical protein XM38_018660 [Halomicronema hongdechloris C2206]|uniref:NAD-dependent epimerase/dehydratase domain-containing protein n=1 Tax=Halomicronema hongdechloris C2206 TaxID=1641165 RepID=A0A1Z3HKU3_9CYAN|nr:hypothetical protein XM38_018660 [Halomicronema hongdechloris C2206]